jgi:hypothetical protein
MGTLRHTMARLGGDRRSVLRAPVAAVSADIIGAVITSKVLRS